MKKALAILYCLLISYSFVSAQRNVTNENGYNKFYYGNGQLASEGYMKNGKPEGYWKTYYVTGITKSEGLRRFFKLDSIWTFYNHLGDTTEIISYRNGVKSGYHIKFEYPYIDGEKKKCLSSKELFIDNSREGKSYYYRNGHLLQIANYKNNLKDGYTFEFNKDSVITKVYLYYKNQLVEIKRINQFDDQGNPNGVWKEYYENGRIHKEFFYKNGKLDGLYKIYDKRGNLISSLFYVDNMVKSDSLVRDNSDNIKETFYENGKRKSYGGLVEGKPVGVHLYYDTLGNITESRIFGDGGVLAGKGKMTSAGAKYGEWEFYFNSGEIQSRGSYNNDVKVGLWKFYDMEGNRIQEGKFANGKPEGDWYWYYTNGKIFIEEFFYYGKRDGEYKVYNEQDSLIISGRYIEGEKEGKWTYVLGDLTKTGNYKFGFRDGEWKYFNREGELIFKGNFLEGAPNGRHKWFYNNGKLKEEQYYVSGIPVKTWYKYDEEGNRIMMITYKDGVEFKINGVRVQYE